MKKRYAASCPISYRPTNDSEQQRKSLLDYIFSGYETCSSSELHDVCLQTDLNMADWDDQYFERIIERFTTGNVGDSRPEEFADIIESGDEEFHSVMEDKLEEAHLDVPHSINIQLKDSPHIILEDGMHKTKITMTSKYLEQNRLELIIGEGSTRNIRLKAGESEIYPTDKAPPSGINISVTDEKDSEKKDAEIDQPYDDGENLKYYDFESTGKRIGLMSIVVDNLEQQGIRQEKYSYNPRGNIVQCVSDYGYLKELDKREFGSIDIKNNEKSGSFDIANAMKLQRDSPMTKKQKNETYKEVKKKFFKNALEGDPMLDHVKKELIEELVRKGYEAPVKETFKSTQVQTEVHIHPGANDDYSFSDSSDSILKRFNALRNVSNACPSVKEPSQTKELLHQEKKQTDEKKDKNTHEYTHTYEATIGQIDTDFSTRTEPTMEGISDLTDRNVVEIPKEKDDATDDDVSDFSTKPKKSHSTTSIERRSKLTDTRGLEDDGTKDVANLSDREVKSPSLLKALKSFDEELNPLQQELTRLLSDFKSIDITEDVQISVAAGRLPQVPSTSAEVPFPTPTHHYPNPDESIHHLYRTGLPQPMIRSQPCHCAPGTCLGFRRSSGIICQRIKRLRPSVSSSEFFREFTRPAWISESYRPHSILSDPEDIYGDRISRPASSLSIHTDDIYNKRD
ncbi:uncharacterized protein [Halyomorpha halys]|uniref:uncharacterized protein n=1 Tax=Halyomorpha halys TaxID=286706 RepID=UPI0006D4EBEF|nr:uncharacterized protein LOC106684750 [Halyomorpha halys]